MTEKETDELESFSSLDFNSADRMVENVISLMPIPLGVATNFIINKRDYLIPMATEESSVIAAASYAAKLARTNGGFTSSASDPVMIGQIQLKNIKDINKAILKINNNKQNLIESANKCDAVLLEHGGGVKDILCRSVLTNRGKMLIVHLLVDVRDAMGANVVNIMSEKITDSLEKLTGGQAGLRIVSNLSVYRTVKSSCIWRKLDLGEQVIDGILDSYALASVDQFRCVTHNKGIMNGIDALAVATGNDFRAIEAGAHGFACFNKSYSPLASYYKSDNGDLIGELEMPLSVGIIGGITNLHPISKIVLKILGVKTSNDLSVIMGAVGLAQNFAALRALVSEGITRGHMRLHSKNIAIIAGVPEELIDKVSNKMIREENISVSRAREIFEQLKIEQLKNNKKI